MDRSMVKKMSMYLTPYTQMKWVIDFNESRRNHWRKSLRSQVDKCSLDRKINKKETIEEKN